MRSKIIIGSLAGFLMGIFLSHSSLHTTDPTSIDFYAAAGKKLVTIVGTVVEEPDVRRGKVNYTIDVKDVKGSKDTKEIHGRILISAEKYPEYQYGDTLEITGQLEKPAVFDTFDYAAYLSRYDIYAVMSRPKIKKISAEISPVATPYKFLLDIKQSFESHLNLIFTEPSASLMAGLLLGSRKGLPDDLSNDFKTTGLTHIIAISGYNITLIATLLLSLFAPFGKRPSRWLAGMGIIVFTIFVGASAAVVRACIMGLISLVAISSARKTAITITLLITAAIMCAWNPKILLNDVGFQLSFLATMGLIYISPLLNPAFTWLPKKFGVRDSVTLTLSAQIMAMPVILMNFNNLSLISPLSNLLISGPVIPFAMLSGFVAVITSYASITIAKLLAFPGYLLTEYVIHVIRLSARVPFAALKIEWFSQGLFLLYYLILAVFLIKHWKMIETIERHIISLQLRFQQRIAHRAWADHEGTEGQGNRGFDSSGKGSIIPTFSKPPWLSKST